MDTHATLLHCNVEFDEGFINCITMNLFIFENASDSTCIWHCVNLTSNNSWNMILTIVNMRGELLLIESQVKL